MTRTETTNAPAEIAKQPRMTSINTALQVDLFDQANASRVHGRIYSGFGGQTDFTVGAIHSKGGQALMALRSWHPARTSRRSSRSSPLRSRVTNTPRSSRSRVWLGCGVTTSASRRTTSSSRPRTRASASGCGRRPRRSARPDRVQPTTSHSGAQPRPCSRAATIAAERSATPILVRTLARTLRTVFGLSTSRRAMVGLS